MTYARDVRAVLLVLACAGCDGVFGLDTVPLAVDASHAIDATPPGDVITGGSLELVLPAAPTVYVGDVVKLALSLHGPANAAVDVGAVATVGMATPAMTARTLDPNGLDNFDVTYTAPAAPGPDQISFTATSGSLGDAKNLALTVMPLKAIGIDSNPGHSQTVNASDAIGARLTITAPVTVRKLGVWVVSGVDVRMAVYNVQNSDPYQLQVASAPQALVPGRNVIDVAPTMLPAGTYWIVASFDAATVVDYTLSGLYGASSYPYASGMPAVWSATWVDVANSTFALFALVE